jgi:hypothetical protein
MATGKTLDGVQQIWGKEIYNVAEDMFQWFTAPASPKNETPVEEWDEMHSGLKEQYPIPLEDFGKDFINSISFLKDYKTEENYVELRMAANVIRKIINNQYGIDITMHPHTPVEAGKEDAGYWRERCEAAELCMSTMRELSTEENDEAHKKWQSLVNQQSK